VTKFGMRYAMNNYKSESAVDASEIGGSLHLTQKLGSRIDLGLGYSYNKKTFSNNTGYTEHEIPFDLGLDLTICA